MYYFVNRKNTVRFEHAPFNFVSVYLFVLTFAMKLKDVNYKSHSNISVFCDQLKTMSDLKKSHEKILFGFTLVIKLRNFDFKSY